MLEADEQWLAYSSTELKGYIPPTRRINIRRAGGPPKDKEEPVDELGLLKSKDHERDKRDGSKLQTGADEDESAANRSSSSFNSSDRLPLRT